MDYYKTNLILKTEFGFLLEEMESMFPYEREIYVALLIEQQKKKKEKANQ